MEFTKEHKQLLDTVLKQLLPTLMAVHIYRMSKEQCMIRAREDIATISLLIIKGHLILKHKEGETVNATLNKIRNKNSQENSST